MKCPQCDAVNSENSKFCEECGYKLMDNNDTKQNMKARLTLIRGGNTGREYILETDVTNIGRWDPDGGAFPEIDLTNEDAEAKISRKHARIIRDDNRFLLEDLGSLNGSYINRGPRIVPGEPQEIKDSDELILGKTFFKFEMI